MEKIKCSHCGFDELDRPIEPVHFYWCPKCGSIHFVNAADNSVRFQTPENLEPDDDF